MITGACRCGSVKYHFNKNDIVTMYCCHCSICRKSSGSAFSSLSIVRSGSFKIGKGDEKIVKKGTDSFSQYHCGECYSWVFGASGQAPKGVLIPCGTFNEDPGRWIEFHKYYESRASWIEIKDDLPKYPEDYRSPALLELLAKS